MLVQGREKGRAAAHLLAADAYDPQWPATVLVECAQPHLFLDAEALAAAGIDDGVEVLAFIDDMAARLAHCDVVICRAGAVTVSELCAAGEDQHGQGHRDPRWEAAGHGDRAEGGADQGVGQTDQSDGAGGFPIRRSIFRTHVQ